MTVRVLLEPGPNNLQERVALLGVHEVRDYPPGSEGHQTSSAAETRRHSVSKASTASAVTVGAFSRAPTMCTNRFAPALAAADFRRRPAHERVVPARQCLAGADHALVARAPQVLEQLEQRVRVAGEQVFELARVEDRRLRRIGDRGCRWGRGGRARYGQASQVEGVRRGNVVAFGLHHPDLGREYVVVAAELRAPIDDAAAEDALRQQIQAQILAALALRVDEIVLLAPGSLPKTSSGKLQRRKTAEMFAEGALGKSGGPASKLGLLKHLAAPRWSFIEASLGSRDGE
ncbi:MAG: hypothetical protein ACKPBV_00815 [Sphaerospermopsis kisseleviana]